MEIEFENIEFENIEFENIVIELRSNFENAKKVLSILKKVGRLNQEDSSDVFVELLNHKSRDVRVEAVKNLGKFKNNQILQETIINQYTIDADSHVRRECVSAIGRQRNENRIPFFKEILSDKDPKIVLQAIRSLLVFKSHEDVKNELTKIKNHPNEMIKDVLNIELKEKNSSNEKKNEIKHSVVNPLLKNVAVNGDVLEVLKLIKDESFHLTFTSPPYYNARDYSFYSSYQEYLDFLRNVFKETHRLTKEGRFLIVNSSPVIVPRVSRAHSSKRYPIPFDMHNFLMKDGWEFVDDIIWQKPEFSVKNRVGGFLQHRKPLAYKPNSITEYLMVYRKKSDRLIDWNLKQYDLETIESSKVEDGFETTNVWRVDTSFDKTHSAVFPKGLCERVLKYYSMKGDLVFDPFGGSGTFGEVAIDNERNYFLTEIDNVYFERIKERLSKVNVEKQFLPLKEFKEILQSR
jgi:DNA modification methylase